MRSNTKIETKLIIMFLRPSWLSGLIAIAAGIAIPAGAVLLSLYGTTVQQSLIGLHDVYQQSPIGLSVQLIGNHFASNSLLNNSLLFLFWGLVGLVIYSIVESIGHEIKSADTLVHEMDYARTKRNDLIRSVAARALIRGVALGLWWLSLRLLIFKLLPYVVASAHEGSIHPSNHYVWLRLLMVGVILVVGVHLLAILLRFVFLRARLFSSEIVD